MGEGRPTHDCKEVLEEVYASHPDLRDRPISNPDWTLYTDGTSLVKLGQRLSGYAVVTERTVVEAGPLPQHWSAQRAELWALVQALQLSKGKRVNVYTDSRYAFATLHIHGALHWDRGLLTANGKDIKNKEEILTLLDTVWSPTEVAVVHCRGHQREDTPQARGNKLADETSRRAAEDRKESGEIPMRTFVLAELPELALDSLTYTKAQNQLAEAEGATKTEKGWWELPGGKLLVPGRMAPSLVSPAHHMTHLGHDKLEDLIRRYFLVPRLSSLCRMESQNCNTCSQINAAPGCRPKPPGIQLKDTLPFEHLEVNFPEMKPYRHFCYLSVLVCTFSGWVENFPTRTERSSEVARSLLREIVPRFGFPTSIGSDNGPAFISDLIQQVSKAMNVKWKLHTAYWPQSSRMVE